MSVLKTRRFVRLPVRALLFLAAILFFSVVGFSPVVLRAEESLLFYVPFDGSPDASFAKGDPKAKLAGSLSYEDGHRGKAVFFSKGVYLSYSLAGNFSLERGSLSVWLKPLDFTGEAQTFVPFWGVRDAQRLALLAHLPRGGPVAFHIFEGGFSFSRVSGDAFAESDKWYHLVLTYAPREMRLYENGLLTSIEKRADTALPQGAKRFELGFFPDAGDSLKQVIVSGEVPRFFSEGLLPGKVSYLMDDLAIFGRPLTSEEVRLLSEKGPIEFEKSPAPFSSDLSICFYPDKNRLVASLNTNVVPDGKTSVYVVIRRADTGEAAIRYPLRISGGVFERAIINVAGLPPAKYEVQGLVFRGENLISETESHPFRKVEPPEWWDNETGKSDRLLLDLTPVEKDAVKKTIACWGRKYRFGTGLFPEVISSQGKNLLAAPPRFRLVRRGRNIPAEEAIFKLVRSSESKAVVRMSGDQGPFFVRSEATLEFDGFTSFQVELRPELGGTVDELILEIPLDRKYIRYFLYPGRRKVSLPEKPWKGGFVPYLWLGGDEVGLLWCAESQQDWSLQKTDEEIEVVPSADRVTLRLHIIDHETPLKKKLFIRFALQPTPVRPLASGWRKARAFPGLLPQKLTEEPQNPFNANFVLGEDVFEGLRLCDVSPAFDTEALLKRNSLFDSAGIRVLPKVPINWIESHSGNNGQAGSLYSLYGEEWASVPTMREGSRLAVCPHASRYTNWLAWLISERLMKGAGFKGLFLDRAWIYPCRNHPHGCGFIVDQDRVKAVYPIVAERGLFRRIATILHEENREGLIIAHYSGFKATPYLSFADFHFDKSDSFPNAPLSKKHLSPETLDFVRALYSPEQWGIPTILGLTDAAPQASTSDETRVLLALTELHDVLIYPVGADLSLIQDSWKARDRFGVGDENVEFLGYWENSDILESSAPGVYVSLYRKPEKALLIVSNLSESEKLATLKVNLARMGFGGVTPRVLDASSGEAISLSGDILKVSLPAASVRWILMEKPD